MRRDLDELLQRAEVLAVSPTARQLVELVRELDEVAELAAAVRGAQQAYFRLARDSKVTEAQKQRALQRSKDLEARLDKELARLGIRGQTSLPGLG